MRWQGFLSRFRCTLSSDLRICRRLGCKFHLDRPWTCRGTKRNSRKRKIWFNYPQISDELYCRSSGRSTGNAVAPISCWKVELWPPLSHSLFCILIYQIYKIVRHRNIRLLQNIVHSKYLNNRFLFSWATPTRRSKDSPKNNKFPLLSRCSAKIEISTSPIHTTWTATWRCIRKKRSRKENHWLMTQMLRESWRKSWSCMKSKRDIFMKSSTKGCRGKWL